jgi:transposase
MKRSEVSTKSAGIDVAKATLEVALADTDERLQIANSAAGFATLAAWLDGHKVRRVGLEASGGYERAVAEHLRGLGLEVVVHQPAEVRAFARFKRIKAKNDQIDAKLIALATAQVEGVRAANDPRLVELAEWMTAYEQAADRLAQMKTCLEHVTQAALKAGELAQIKQAQLWKAQLLRAIVKRIKACPDLARRYALLQSLPGCGPVVAASLLIRMPELGALQHGRAASLIGVAPFDRDTGQSNGKRHISGGRGRPRRMLYIAALAASRFDPGFRAFVQRLKAAGKETKVALTALMRKIIEAANLVLARGTPWVETPAL